MRTKKQLIEDIKTCIKQKDSLQENIFNIKERLYGRELMLYRRGCITAIEMMNNCDEIESLCKGEQ